MHSDTIYNPLVVSAVISLKALQDAGLLHLRDAGKQVEDEVIIKKEKQVTVDVTLPDGTIAEVAFATYDDESASLAEFLAHYCNLDVYGTFIHPIISATLDEEDMQYHALHIYIRPSWLEQNGFANIDYEFPLAPATPEAQTALYAAVNDLKIFVEQFFPGVKYPILVTSPKDDDEIF